MDESRSSILAGERRIPIFPLPNVVLFPKVHLPLHIFEPRYREMVRDAAAGDKIIGMALFKGDWKAGYYGNPEIYRVGCAGRIEGITPFPDGRYNILLYGLKEFEIKEQILDQTSYRQARVGFRTGEGAEGRTFPPSLRQEIQRLLEKAYPEGDPEIVETLKDPGLKDETWLNLCCFSADISMVEKQSLLEAGSLEERGVALLHVLQFQAAEQSATLSRSKEPGDKEPLH